jgi:hypothetical protein
MMADDFPLEKYECRLNKFFGKCLLMTDSRFALTSFCKPHKSVVNIVSRSMDEMPITRNLGI